MLVFSGLLANPSWAASEADSSWPKWRGPAANGTSPTASPPLTWSETKNLRWKVSTPGFGTSTPIVWGNNVILLSALPSGDSASEGSPQDPGARSAPDKPYRFVVLCLDRKTGRTLWQKTAIETVPHEAHHRDHGYASASPVTDGELLFAYFGSRGLHAYDLAGNHKWSKQFGQMRTRNSFGEGASPALHGDRIFVGWDDEGDSDFVAALDKRTGKELWRTARSEPTGWSTPLVVEHGGKTQVIVNATGQVRSYDGDSGAELWRCAGQTANVVPTPVALGDMVLVTSGFRGSALFALALSGRGDLAGSESVRWSYNKQTPYVPSPLLAGELLYFVAGNNGILSCLDARTGKPHYAGEKLEGITGVYASPVSAADRVYLLGRDGSCLVLRKGPKFEVLAQNKLDDKTDASIALAGADLFIRGHKSLYCLSEPSSQASSAR